LEALIREKVASGAYRDESEVVGKALELLARYEAEVEAKREALRGMIKEGLESGESRETDIDLLIGELNAKFDRR
jgi:putative addiction module CopG family antidote